MSRRCAALRSWRALPVPGTGHMAVSSPVGTSTEGGRPAPQAGQCAGIPGGWFAPALRALWDQRGRDDPADPAFCRQGAGEPRATRPRCRQRQGGLLDCSRRMRLDVTLSWTDVAEGDDLGAVVLSDRGDAHLCGHPDQRRVCETAAWRTSEIVHVSARRLWLLVSEPAVPRRSSRPIGSHYV